MTPERWCAYGQHMKPATAGNMIRKVYKNGRVRFFFMCHGCQGSVVARRVQEKKEKGPPRGS